MSRDHHATASHSDANDDDDDDDFPVHILIQINALMLKIQMLGAVACSVEELRELWPFTLGGHASCFRVLVMLGNAYLERAIEKFPLEFPLAKSFFERAAKIHPAVYLLVAGVKWAQKERKQDVIEVFIKGEKSELISEVPEEHVRQSLLRTRTSLLCALFKTCDGCDYHFTEVKLRACGSCNSPRYCSKACQKKHWKEGHREICAHDSKLSCSVCKMIFETNLSVCSKCGQGRYCSQACLKKDWKTGHRENCTPRKK